MLGANDGIVSVAALVVGVAAATTDVAAILIAGVAAVLAGAISMGLGEYVSVSSQRDTERALIAKERHELETMPQQELAELAELYRAKGLSAATADTVARELTAHDALAAHLEVELHIDEDDVVNPWHAAGASALAFLVGAVLPMLAILLPPPEWRITATFVAVVIALAITGWLSAWIGGSPRLRAVLRVTIGGALALARDVGDRRAARGGRLTMTGAAEARVGISGWVYPNWRGEFYPKGLRQADELEFASRQLTSIEVNGSFYALQKPANWVRWRDAVPDDFVFAVKGPRFITHIKRLGDIDAPLANFLASGVLALGEKLGPGALAAAAEPRVRRAPARRVPGPAAAHARRRRQRSRGIGRSGCRDARRTRCGPRPIGRSSTPSRCGIRASRSTRRRGCRCSSATAWHPSPPTPPGATRASTAPRRTSPTRACTAIASSTSRATTTPGSTGGRRGCARHLAAGRSAYVYFDNDVKVRAPFDAMALIERLQH